jgi:DNA repair exonuclease SbcCD ATPase subunit
MTHNLQQLRRMHDELVALRERVDAAEVAKLAAEAARIARKRAKAERRVVKAPPPPAPGIDIETLSKHVEAIVTNVVRAHEPAIDISALSKQVETIHAVVERLKPKPREDVEAMNAKLAEMRAKLAARDDRIGKYKERVEELETALEYNDDTMPTAVVNVLSAQQSRLLGVLLKQHRVTKEQIRMALRRQLAVDGDSAHYAGAYIAQLRARLGPLGALIKCEWNVGYYITAADKPKIQQWLASLGIAAAA